MTAFFLARPRAARPPQRGAAAIEFAAAGAAVLLLGLLTIEAARWQGVRQVAHLALMEAARAGATSHGDPARIRAAFLQGLLPLHADAQGAAGARRRQTQDLDRAAALAGTTPWRIEILQPDAQAFRDHARPGLDTAAPRGLRAIDHNYQDLQHARRPLPDTRSIFRANTLKLRLTYLYQPLLPPLRMLLAALSKADGSYAAAAQARGLAPIGMELEMEMQSHPVDWPAGKAYPAGMVQGACRSLRCP
ncbi:pilus assembly protein [Achromobacter sp. UMC71]|uniref:pilus assembly protein n=1 Tax=Achromobacter sp. UMC71 TaxID=1862320 RepID=UPI0016006807|nr:pilus assembly protein [Achromobacter sp. UMC71]MBB1627558.1 pilus assembly protein TadE [Achromobacter sp. UMC71]